jgi:putative PIN family toxin of toxin-antitoxin system
MLKVCIDTNIWISGIMFSGKPAEVVTAALNRKFEVVLSTVIVDEIEKNLIGKFKFSRKNTHKLINRILQVADLYEPGGTVRTVADNHPDNLILETAALGRSKFLVTGDKEHLLPLKIFKHVKIVDAAGFLAHIKK